jgi:alcohol dehydrogenase (cytochrome c)
MFLTTPLDHVIALDATTGKVIWTYVPQIDFKVLRAICCDVVNRGVALYGNDLYFGTLDDHLICLDAATGSVVWDKRVAPAGQNYSITGAPLVVDGEVVTGVGGGDYGARGFLAAFDALTGTQRWLHYTIPGPHDPGGDTWGTGSSRGGGDTWVTGSFDPSTHTLFWGAGNPSPWFGGMHAGKNLYADSLLALDASSGNLKWYYQYTPHDSWDYDGVNETVLLTLERANGKIPAIVHADRNGYFFGLDERTGKMLYAKPFVKNTTISGYRSDGSAILNAKNYPVLGKNRMDCPSSSGGKNWYPIAYSPQTELAYVPEIHLCSIMKGTGKAGPDVGYYGEDEKVIPEPGRSTLGEFAAIDVRDGRKRWSYPTKFAWTGGALATAAGLVFSGNARGDFFAFDARTGKVLWKARLSSGILAPPSTYRVDGKQYVAVYAGYGGGLALYGGPAADLTSKIPRGGKLYVFTL